MSAASEEAQGAVVVGGGLAGLAAAAALRHVAGVEGVRVLEGCSPDEFGSERAGASAQLGPNGLRALRVVDRELADRVAEGGAIGTVLKGNVFMSPGGEMIEQADRAMEIGGLPQVLVRWGSLRRELASLLPPGAVRTGVCVSGFSEQKGGLVPITADGSPATEGPAPLLVGADGLYSSLRPLLMRDAPPRGGALVPGEGEVGAMIRDNGRTNIKAVVPRGMPAPCREGRTHGAFLDGIACFAGPASEGHSYWAVSVADGGEGERFLDGIIEAEAKKRTVLDMLGDREGAAFVRDLVLETDAAHILAARSEEAEICDTFVRPGGGLVLVGDAAHAMSNSIGQNANFALEDAAVLALCVRDCEGTLEEALGRYSQLRVARCREMQAKSAERAARSMRGEGVENIDEWVWGFDPEAVCGG